MSINLCWGMDQKKVAKFGKYFGSIDFEVFSTSRSAIKMNRDVLAGTLFIGSREHKLKLSELDQLVYDICYNESCISSGYQYDDLTKWKLERIAETLQNAKQVFFQKYRFGM